MTTALTYTTFDKYAKLFRNNHKRMNSAIRALFVVLSTNMTSGLYAWKVATVTWSGSGATLAATVTGVLSTDIVVATIRVKPTQAAYMVRAVPSTDTITFELSAANTGNDAQISYTVWRALP